jgi:hypothetical protein
MGSLDTSRRIQRSTIFPTDRARPLGRAESRYAASFGVKACQVRPEFVVS